MVVDDSFHSDEVVTAVDDAFVEEFIESGVEFEFSFADEAIGVYGVVFSFEVMYGADICIRVIEYMLFFAFFLIFFLKELLITAEVIRGDLIIFGVGV